MTQGEFRRHALTWIPGLLIGLLAFYIVIPVNIIDPANIGWLGLHEDTRTYFLGWDFYRKTPWQIPISANPNYGIEIAGSIFMTDTIPLLAIPLKILQGVLPSIFQYHGMWLLTCFGLQGVFAWKLATYITADNWLKTCITALFLFQLPFLSRALGHLPLMGHFFILGALFICLQKYVCFSRYWVLLIAGAACTNAYLLLMVLGLWFSDCVRRNIQYRLPNRWKSFLLEVLLLLTMTIFLCWQIGYFSVGGGVSAAGNPYGLYRFNLLSPIDSNGWSLLLRDIPGGPGDREGFTYLGLGFIFLIIAGCLSLLQLSGAKTMQKLPGNPYLLVVLLAFVVYAVTNYVGFGPYSWIIPLPAFLSKFTSVFRGAGRLVWPALYFSLILVSFIVCRNYTRRASIFIFSLAVILQVADTSAGWVPQKAQAARAQASNWNLGLHDPFWDEAGRHYKAVRRLPAGNVTPDWSIFGAYAAAHDMRTDSMYLARVDYSRLAELKRQNQQRILKGDYEPDTLYIVSTGLTQVLKSLDSEKDLLVNVDGYTVIAPRWHERSRMVVASLTGTNYMPEPVRGSTFDMTSLKSPGIRSLASGWFNEFGDGGVWSQGASSTLVFPVKAVEFDTIDFTGIPLVSSVRPMQVIRLSINGEPQHTLKLDGSKPSFSLGLTRAEKGAIGRDAQLKITLEFEDPTSPKALGINTDERVLSFALKRVRFD